MAAVHRPEKARRKERPRLAEVDEPTVIRHYTNLSRKNWGIDTNFYPLGSCTMKHNPRANEAAAASADEFLTRAQETLRQETAQARQQLRMEVADKSKVDPKGVAPKSPG